MFSDDKQKRRTVENRKCNGLNLKLKNSLWFSFARPQPET